MEATIDKAALTGGIWITLLVVYITLGLFSKAKWLQLKWGRWGGGIVPLSKASRVLATLIWTLLETLCFAHAFHFTVPDVFLPAFLVLSVQPLQTQGNDNSHARRTWT